MDVVCNSVLQAASVVPIGLTEDAYKVPSPLCASTPGDARNDRIAIVTGNMLARLVNCCEAPTAVCMCRLSTPQYSTAKFAVNELTNLHFDHIQPNGTGRPSHLLRRQSQHWLKEFLTLRVLCKRCNKKYGQPKVNGKK